MLMDIGLNWNVDEYRFVLDFLFAEKDERLSRPLTHPYNSFDSDLFNILSHKSFRDSPIEKWNFECVDLLISHPAAGLGYFSASEFFYGPRRYLKDCSDEFLRK